MNIVAQVPNIPVTILFYFIDLSSEVLDEELAEVGRSAAKQLGRRRLLLFLLLLAELSLCQLTKLHCSRNCCVGCC
jgi:hypothetical protein